VRGKVPKVPIREALVRTDLWLGCDRIALTVAAVVSALVGIGGGIGFGQIVLVPIGAAIFWAFRELLRKLAKKDPQYLWIWRRTIRERPVYEAVARWDQDDLKPRSWK
jgi:type IV secretory pathway TrbD component